MRWQRTTHAVTSRFAFGKHTGSLPCRAPRLGWRPHGTPGAATAAGSTEQRRQMVHDAEVPGFGYAAPLLTTTMLRVDSPLLPQLFPNLVSLHGVSKPQVSFRKKNITVNPSNEAYSFPLPHLFLPPYHKDKSPFIIQGLILSTCSTAPQS